MKVDVFQEYINQLSKQTISDVSIDNGIIMDIMEQYQVVFEIDRLCVVTVYSTV